MKKLLTILLLTALTAQAEIKYFVCASTSNTFEQTISPLCYVMFRSDYQNQYMTNGVIYQYSHNRVAKSNGTTPVFTWCYSVRKAQKLSTPDKDYISALLTDPQIKKGITTNPTAWFDQYSTQTTNSYTLPIQPIGGYSDKPMQSDPIHFVTMALPSVFTGKKEIILTNWLDIWGVSDTPEHRQTIIDAIITDEYVLASNTNQPVYVIHKDINKLNNESLQARDDFRTALNEPVKSTIGFMRMSQKKNIMNRYGVKAK